MEAGHETLHHSTSHELEAAQGIELGGVEKIGSATVILVHAKLKHNRVARCRANRPYERCRKGLGSDMIV